MGFIKEILQLIIEYKDYAPVYSAVIAAEALGFSIFSFLISNLISEKERCISNKRYDEQKKQYEERIHEERKQREEDKKEAEERFRVTEEPCLVFKKVKVVSEPNADQMILRMEFANKGKGAAYYIKPDVECTAKRIDMTEFTIHRHEAVQDPIAMVSEVFAMKISYDNCNSKQKFFRMTITIRFEDTSGRKYKQFFEIDIDEKLESGLMINEPRPEICKEQISE